MIPKETYRTLVEQRRKEDIAVLNRTEYVCRQLAARQFRLQPNTERVY